METFVNIAIPVAMFMVGAAALLALGLPLIKALSEPKVLLKSLLGVAVIAVIFLIGWALAGDEVTAKYASKGIATATSSKLVGGALSTMYILFVVAVIGIVYSEFNKALK